MPAWFAGREAVTRFFESRVLAAPGRFRMVPTMANGQPAFAAYRRGRDGAYEAHALQVLTSPQPGSRGSSSSSTRPCSARSACRRATAPPRPRRQRR